MDIPYLTQPELEALGITATDVINSVEHVIRGAADGTVWAAPKAVITTPADQRYMMAALAAMDGPSLLAVKTVVLNPDNPEAGLPQINGLVTMLDSQTGLPAAILDGNWITAVRTAGLSATAARRMADPAASTIGFVGCGVQARSHLDAFAEIFPLKHMRMFGRGQANKDLLAQAAEQHGLTVEDCASGQEVVENCDLLVTTVTHTGGAVPFLDATGMRAGAFAAIVDLGAPWVRDSIRAFEPLVIDDTAQEAALENKLCAPDLVSGDLSDLVMGRLPARGAGTAPSAFLFRGHALGDLALSVLALEKHRALIDG